MHFFMPITYLGPTCITNGFRENENDKINFLSKPIHLKKVITKSEGCIPGLSLSDI